MPHTHTGKCACGAVSFTARGELREVVYCHCSQCRRQTGHFLASTNVPDARLEVRGAEHVTWFQSSDDAKRGFCGRCGSGLFWKHRSLDYTSILAGAFDVPSSLKSGKHIFVADKGDYYEIADGLPKYARSSADVMVAGD
jgi:hypothetical protein